MRKIFIILIIVFICTMSLLVAGNKSFPNNNVGTAVIEMESGYGWVFVYTEKRGTWQAHSAFKGRIIELPTGNYSFVFTKKFNYGVPPTDSEFKEVNIKKGKTTIIKSDALNSNKFWEQ